MPGFLPVVGGLTPTRRTGWFARGLPEGVLSGALGGLRYLSGARFAVEGGLDAASVLVVADGVPELALRDGGVPAIGAVAVAALECPDGVLGVAQSVYELARLVG